MPRGPNKLSDATKRETIEAIERTEGRITTAANLIGIDRSTFGHRVRRCIADGYLTSDHTVTQEGRRFLNKEFHVEELPSEIPPVKELWERRIQEYERKDAAEKARRLIPVKVNMDGPIGILHMGDPHVDDPGTDARQLLRDIDLINNTEGLFGANVGDLHNNWIGRIAHLYGQQSTSAQEAWALVDDFVKSVRWLYLIGGNHDVWSGSGDPLRWITRHQGIVFEDWGARLNLKFPNGKQIRINARHDFTGHSMWNTAHGPAKAVQMGWRDHILTCGHKHTSGYQILKCPATGLISHAMRVAGYKIHDRYAKEKDLPNQNITPAVVTIIDPQYEDDDPRLVTVIHDAEEGAEYLTWKRGKK